MSVLCHYQMITVTNSQTATCYTTTHNPDFLSILSPFLSAINTPFDQLVGEQLTNYLLG